MESLSTLPWLKEVFKTVNMGDLSYQLPDTQSTKSKMPNHWRLCSLKDTRKLGALGNLGNSRPIFSADGGWEFDEWGFSAQAPVYMNLTKIRNPELSDLVYDPVAQTSTEAAHYWRGVAGNHFRQLLEIAQYSEENVKRYSYFFDKYIAIALGPQPDATGNAQWPCPLTNDWSPLCFSLNLSAAQTTVRFTIDPFPIAASKSNFEITSSFPTQFAVLMEQVIPGVSLEWFWRLRSVLIVGPGYATRMSQFFFAFDFNVVLPRLKCYMRGIDAKCILHGVGRQELVTNACRAIGLELPWRKVTTYLNVLPENVSRRVSFIGIDCEDPSVGPRMKVYTHFAIDHEDLLVQHLTLGGAISKDVDHKFSREIWKVFTTDANTDRKRENDVLVYYDFRASSSEPTAKFYLRVEHYYASDMDIVTKVTRFLKSKNMEVEANCYLRSVQSLCAHRSLQDRVGMHTHIGCQYRNNGWEVTVYVSPELYAPERK